MQIHGVSISVNSLVAASVLSVAVSFSNRHPDERVHAQALEQTLPPRRILLRWTQGTTTIHTSTTAVIINVLMRDVAV